MLLPDLLAIFMMGLLGSGHCLAMCGGMASAMSMQSEHQWLHLSFYNIGRLFSYGVMGAVVGGLVGGMIHATELTQSSHWFSNRCCDFNDVVSVANRTIFQWSYCDRENGAAPLAFGVSAYSKNSPFENTISCFTAWHALGLATMWLGLLSFKLGCFIFVFFSWFLGHVGFWSRNFTLHVSHRCHSV